MRDYRRRCFVCGEIFDYREAIDVNKVICGNCSDFVNEEGEFDADELGLDPEEEFDA